MASMKHECKVRIDAQVACVGVVWLQTAGQVKPCWLARHSSLLLLVVGGWWEPRQGNGLTRATNRQR